MKSIKLCALFIGFLSLVFVKTLLAEEEYTLGSGDIVRITVYEHEDLNLAARINEKGNITFPLIGEVTIGENTVAFAERIISKALEKGGFVHEPQVSIVIEQYRSRQVSVLGEVRMPGKYTIEGASSIIDLIALAGGVSDKASEFAHLITTKQGKPLQIRVDLHKILFDGDVSQIVDVDTGDIIFIPKMDRFYIYGEVQRPGVFRLERNMIVMQALAVGGGVTPRGTERGLIIKRINSDGEVLEIDASANDLLIPNDVIYIKESLF
ncbi:MAG TPA: polysaccharide export protein EpsE [Gammaproteobacteria bacterium]|nr:polysaccharide export protein EpsE [Gammaproteobacteria bacterium]